MVVTGIELEPCVRAQQKLNYSTTEISGLIYYKSSTRLANLGSDACRMRLCTR
jgi:CRISPR/Cas system-associated protein Csm6